MGPVPEPYKAFPTGTAVVLQMLMAYYMYVKYFNVLVYLKSIDYFRLEKGVLLRKNVNLTYFDLFLDKKIAEIDIFISKRDVPLCRS